MAGLSGRFCKQAKPYICDEPEYKGLCGMCSGACQPCDEAGNNCGDWQDCECAGGESCGDGHDCHRYIDIEFTLDSFVIQGQVCTNASGVPLTQQCGGGGEPAGGVFDGVPVLSPPTGWSSVGDGTSEFVYYDATVHRIRLTRSDCGCFWGGYWSSSCDCNTCCCTDEAVGEYPDCTVASCLFGSCYQSSGDLGCRACDPSNPCHPIDDGYASSLDTYGTGEVGGSDGQAMCVKQSDSSGDDDCDYVTSACDGYNATSYAGWNTGNFKPHHIEAYLTYQAQSVETCNSGWQLEIRGLTELSRSEMGLAGSYPSLDCTGGATGCSRGNGGNAEAALGYRGQWWGLTECLGEEDYCVCNLACDQSGDTPVERDLVFHGCSCPPAADFESSIGVHGSLEAFHPSSVFASNADEENSGSMYTCVVNDAEGNNAPTVYCNSDIWHALHEGDMACLGKQYQGDGEYSRGTCYGSPAVWWDRCDHCITCCPSEPLGCDVPCSCGSDPEDCTCSWPVEVIPDNGVPIEPCKNCFTEPSYNHESCNPCEGQQSHQCATCRIKMRPNSNPTPWWVE